MTLKPAQFPEGDPFRSGFPGFTAGKCWGRSTPRVFTLNSKFQPNKHRKVCARCVNSSLSAGPSVRVQLVPSQLDFETMNHVCCFFLPFECISDPRIAFLVCLNVSAGQIGVLDSTTVEARGTSNAQYHPVEHFLKQCSNMFPSSPAGGTRGFEITFFCVDNTTGKGLVA